MKRSRVWFWKQFRSRSKVQLKVDGFKFLCSLGAFKLPSLLGHHPDTVERFSSCGWVCHVQGLQFSGVPHVRHDLLGRVQIGPGVYCQ